MRLDSSPRKGMRIRTVFSFEESIIELCVPTSSEGKDNSKAYPGAAKSTSASSLSLSLTLVLRMSDIDCLGLRSDGKQRKARSLSPHASFG